jgi:hypothetical protein
MLVETRAVESYGGRVSILDYVRDVSTTALVKRIRKTGAPHAAMASRGPLETGGST